MSNSKTFRTFALAVACALSMTAHAVADTPKTVNVVAGNLSDALETLAKQCGVDVIYPSSHLKGLTTEGVSGVLETRAAFQELLRGTRLVMKEEGGSVLITLPTVEPIKITARAPEAGVMRLAQSENPQNQNSSALSSEAQDEKNKENNSSASSDAKENKEQEIIVTGTRLPATVNQAAPVTVFDRSRIDELGVSNLADVLNYLPQQSFSNLDSSTGGGARRVQLRGLGNGTTLVLINGRRAVVSGLSNTLNFFDLNTIPLSAVERVEIVSQAASAVYGADAVAGVVNVILKDDVSRPVVELSYGGAEGGAEERRASATLGTQFQRLSITASLDYFERDQLLGFEREAWDNQDYRPYGAPDRRVATANPGNICAVSGNLPGLPTPCAAVPNGSTGIGLTPADFLATAGQQNLESTRRYSSIAPETERHSAFLTATFDVTPDTAIFGEFLYNWRQNTTLLIPNAISNRLVPASNAFNPFGVPVRATFLFTGNEEKRQQFSEQETLRAVLGARGTLLDWDWEISALGTRDEGFQDNTRNSFNLALVDAALASSNPDTALNVFMDGPGGSQALLSSLMANPLLSRTYGTSEALQIGAFARGELFSLPGGVVDSVIGVEARSEEIGLRAGATDFLPNGATRDTRAVFAELRVPIVSPEMQVPFVNDLNLTLAGRYDDFSDFGDTFNPQYGVVWGISDQFLIRASYGTSFRTPTLWSLNRASAETPTAGITDPRRGNEVVTAIVRSGGNPDLGPETSDFFSAGFVFTRPENRLRITGTYWSISQDSRNNTLGPLVVVNNESIFPSRVVRDSPSPSDIAAGRPGPILRIDTTEVNFGALETSGFDLEADATIRLPVGELTPSIALTWIDTYQVSDFPGVAPAERVGVADFSGTTGTIPEFRANATLTWALAGVSIATTARYISSYEDRLAGTSTPNGMTVNEQLLFDLQLSARLGELFNNAATDGVEIRAGVRNLFDEAPPFSDAQGRGYDQTLGDPIQRFGYIRISKTF